MENKTLELIIKRRSIRKFTGEPVTNEQIEAILRAAMSAPSARNEQPWRFIVITDKAKMAEVCLAHPYAKFGLEAGAVIIPFGEKARFYTHQDLAAATQNLLLAVTGLGLGATWCGMNDERQPLIKPLVNLPEDQWAFAVIPIGVPAEEKPARTQYDEAKIYWQTYK